MRFSNRFLNFKVESLFITFFKLKSFSVIHSKNIIFYENINIEHNNGGKRMVKPLQGIRVLDLGHVLSMPTCTMQLASLGAEVIKIERPGLGDDARRFGPFINGESGYFISINCNKKSITLDLKKEKGKDIFKELVKKVDIVTENFRPGTMAKMGLDYENLKKINHGIIYASISGFGHKSVDKKRPGYDIIAQAVGGIMAITGYPDSPPTRTGFSAADIFSGTFSTIGILAALRYRDITGEGQSIDISMMDSAVSVLENALVRYTSTGILPTRIGSQHPSITPFDVFETRDGWVVIAIGNDSLWKKFCKAANLEILLENPNYSTNEKRTESYQQLKPIISKWTKNISSESIISQLNEAGIPVGNVNNVEDIIHDPNIKLRDMLVDIEHPVAGKMTIVNSPIKLSKSENVDVSPAPLLGEHTTDVLKTILGLSQENIDKLKKEQIV